MNDILDLAKEIGFALQEDDRYIRMQMAQAAADEDEVLQGLIGEFNLKRIAVNNEATKSEEEKNPERMKVLDQELREVYARIMANANMAAYQQAKEEMDVLMRQINTIITLSAQGVNPDEALESGSGCSGSCATCGGCQ